MDQLERDLRVVERQVVGLELDVSSQIVQENALKLTQMQRKLAELSSFIPKRTLSGISSRLDQLISLCQFNRPVATRLRLDSSRSTSDDQKLKIASPIILPSIPNDENFFIRGIRDGKIENKQISSSVIIENCEGIEEIVIGPCQGPIFLRELRQCTLYLACYQLRLLNCHNLTVHCLRCVTQPVLEACTEIIFKTIEIEHPVYQYSNLIRDLQLSKLSETSNQCMQPIDFDSF